MPQRSGQLPAICSNYDRLSGTCVYGCAENTSGFSIYQEVQHNVTVCPDEG